ncbi:MAG: hypothetical protein ACR2OZ_06520 [Verrucomicrobiales bacterium]
MRKRLLLFAALALLLFVAAVAVFGWLAVKEITPERLVREIEASRNCRARIDGCKLALFASPARLDVTGVTLVPRDTEADNATAVATRPPIELHATYFRFASATIEADLFDLIFRRRLTVRQFVVRNADVKCDLLPGGENTLKILFDSPGIVGGKPMRAPLVAAPIAAAAAAAQTVTDAAASAAENGEETKSKRAFNVRDFGIPSTVERVALENSRLRFRNRKSRAVTEFNGCNVSLTDIAINPSDLTAANRATLAISTKLFLDGRDKKTKENFRYADLIVEVRGEITPFELGGNLNPDMALDAVLRRDSAVERLPVLQKLQKSVSKAQRAGLQLNDLAVRTTLLKDATLKLKLHDNRMELTHDVELPFQDYALALQAGSFIDAGEETHDFRATWTASQAMSDQALRGADEFLSTLGQDAAKELRAMFISPMVKNGLISLAFVSQGDLDDPKVTVENPITDFKDRLKAAGEGLLEGIQGAFGKGNK